MALRKIRIVGDEVLRKKAKKVDKFDSRLHQLIDDMKETMYDANGIGLAAPQVGILKRVIVIDIGDQLIEMVNPQIINSEGKEIDIEGCLSVPEKWGEVERPLNILVKGFDRFGNEIEVNASGLLARAFCHEIDHLDGILFTDRSLRLLSREEIEEIKKDNKKRDLS